ncbi:MAG TPA: ABC transporter permease subunit, partial [Gemmatimonadaceae bacterium]|nr:ABC transporter permease subunit [Gemmatimonadaceae bacterium]
IAGEITSGTIQALATKPIARWQILGGKFVGFAAMIVAFVALTFFGTIAVAFAATGVLPEHPARGFALMTGECVLVLAVTLYLGTRFTTLTVGVLALGLQGVAFMGGWLEQVSGFSQSQQIVTLGVITSLVMPSESLWRRAAFEMQTPLAGSLSFSPFANVSIPSTMALVYAGLFAACIFSAALWRLARRDL